MRESLYSSVHINLNKELSEEIIQWGDDNIQENDIFFDLSNHFYGREDEPHVTLLFGLHTSNPNVVSPLLVHHPFEVTLEDMFMFESSPSFNVLAIKANAPELYALNNKMRTQLPYTNRYNYMPHVTIAYVKKKRYIPMNNAFKNKKFLADHYIFSSSLGLKKRFQFS